MLNRVNNMLSSGILYIVATPIGNLADITYRAVTLLNQVAVIAAEDTRHSRTLLQHYNINTPLISLHDFNEQQKSDSLIKRLQTGESIALISDAGTPLISDPGYQLVHKAHMANIKVVPIPGACAAIAALSAAGLPTDSFLFKGFLSAKSTMRQQQLQSIKDQTSTIILYEAPHRIIDLITDMIKILGNEREGVIAKELTKTFETIYSANLANIKQWLGEDANHCKGEFVILIKGSTITKDEEINNQAKEILNILLRELPTSQAVKLTAEITHIKKNYLYDYALNKKDN
jgi:16S rRNA (cytidine1402-2'-O)-methyltransferase